MRCRDSVSNFDFNITYIFHSLSGNWISNTSSNGFSSTLTHTPSLTHSIRQPHRQAKHSAHAVCMVCIVRKCIFTLYYLLFNTMGVDNAFFSYWYQSISGELVRKEFLLHVMRFVLFCIAIWFMIHAIWIRSISISNEFKRLKLINSNISGDRCTPIPCKFLLFPYFPLK